MAGAKGSVINQGRGYSWGRRGGGLDVTSGAQSVYREGQARGPSTAGRIQRVYWAQAQTAGQLAIGSRVQVSK